MSVSNSSQSDTLQVKSPHSCKIPPESWYILGSPKTKFQYFTFGVEVKMKNIV